MDDEPTLISYKWYIFSLIIPTNTKICSYPFSTVKNVNFDVSIGKGTEDGSVNIQVRKSDPRLASAVISIELSRQDNFLPSNLAHHKRDKYSTTIDQNVTNMTYRLIPLDDMTENKELYDWAETCTFNFSKFQIQPFIDTNLNDCCIEDIMVNCQIVWYGFNKLEVEKIPSGLPSFLKSNEFSDVILVVDNHELPAHKVILSAHSPYFHAMFTTDMKENKENRVEIQNFTIDLITEMLKFCYTITTDATDDIDVALQMIPVADMYQIQSLKDICETTMLENINLRNVLTILRIADDFNLTELRRKTIIYMRDNKKCIIDIPEFEKLVYEKPHLMYKFTCAIACL